MKSIPTVLFFVKINIFKDFRQYKIVRVKFHALVLCLVHLGAFDLLLLKVNLGAVGLVQIHFAQSKPP